MENIQELVDCKSVLKAHGKSHFTLELFLSPHALPVPSLYSPCLCVYLEVRCVHQVRQTVVQEPIHLKSQWLQPAKVTAY